MPSAYEKLLGRTADTRSSGQRMWDGRERCRPSCERSYRLQKASCRTREAAGRVARREDHYVGRAGEVARRGRQLIGHAGKRATRERIMIASTLERPTCAKCRQGGMADAAVAHDPAKRVVVVGAFAVDHEGGVMLPKRAWVLRSHDASFRQLTQRVVLIRTGGPCRNERRLGGCAQHGRHEARGPAQSRADRRLGALDRNALRGLVVDSTSVDGADRCIRDLAITN